MIWLYVIGYLLIGIIIGAVGIAILDFDTKEQCGFAIMSSIAWPLTIFCCIVIGLAAVARLLGRWLRDLPRIIRRRKRK